jgi:hypothetical protein
MNRHAGAVLAALLTACRGRDTGICVPSLFGPSSDPDCQSPAPPTCDAILSESWSVMSWPEFPVGESRLLSLSSFAGYPPLTVCAGRVRTVTWEVADPSVVSLIPEAQTPPSRVWVTGIVPGRTLVTARIHFVDGSEKVGAPAEVRIVAVGGPPGARVIASARLSFEGASPQCSASSSSCSDEPFDLPAAGRVDIVVDWGSPLNRVAFNLFAGHCSGVPSCSQLVSDGGGPGVKPARA